MSTRPGNHVKKKPGQKYQNTHAYKVNKYKTDPTAKTLKDLRILNCCEKCTSVLEWKIKYGKYKPLTVPGKCVDCLQKNVKHSYHIRCAACVEKTGKCAKCGVKLGSGEFVNLPGPGQSQIEKEEADFQRDLKCLPERRRRAFLRYLQKFNGEIDPETNPENPREKLTNLLSKYGKDNDDFDLGDDFDDLDLDDDDDDNFSD